MAKPVKNSVRASLIGFIANHATNKFWAALLKPWHSCFMVELTDYENELRFSFKIEFQDGAKEKIWLTVPVTAFGPKKHPQILRDVLEEILTEVS